MRALADILKKQGKIDDFLLALDDPKVQKDMLVRYGVIKPYAG